MTGEVNIESIRFHLDRFCKKAPLKIFLQNSQEKTCARVSFLTRWQAVDLQFL